MLIFHIDLDDPVTCGVSVPPRSRCARTWAWFKTITNAKQSLPTCFLFYSFFKIRYYGISMKIQFQRLFGAYIGYSAKSISSWFHFDCDFICRYWDSEYVVELLQLLSMSGQRRTCITATATIKKKNTTKYIGFVAFAYERLYFCIHFQYVLFLFARVVFFEWCRCRCGCDCCGCGCCCCCCSSYRSYFSLLHFSFHSPSLHGVRVCLFAICHLFSSISLIFWFTLGHKCV